MSDEYPAKLWNRNFVILWAGLAQSYMGDAFLAIGLMWLALQMTDSSAIAGVVLALEAIPKLLGPLAGAILDRVNKRWLMIGTDLIRGVILIVIFILYFLDWLRIWHLYVLVIILGALSVAYDPALRVILPMIVPDKTLPKANSILQATLQISTIAGTTLAGIVLGVLGTPSALLIDGISFFILTVALWFVKFPPVLLQSIGMQASQVLRDMFAGLRFIILTQEVLALTFMAFFLNLVLGPVNVIFPIFSKDILGGGVTGFGLLASAIAIGLLIGNVVVGVIGDRLLYTWTILIGMLGMVIMLVGLSLAQTLVPALLMTVGLGMTAMVIQVPMVTRLQRAVPMHYQGRVFATVNAVVTIAIPLAAVLAGRALLFLPVPVIFRSAALGSFIVAGFWLGISIKSRVKIISPSS